MTEQELIEQLAEKEHASWARWMEYLFSTCSNSVSKPGDLVIPAKHVRHWMRQIETPYAALSEHEKQMDRDEVAHILPIIREFVERQVRPTKAVKVHV